MNKLLDHLRHIKNNFEDNVAIVKKLMKFDEVVQVFCLNRLRKANEGLEKFGCAEHPSYTIKPMIEQIQNIRQNDSLQPSYEIMFNGCVVLLVSYFGSAIEDIFRKALQEKIYDGKLGQLENQEIKLTIRDLVDNKNIVELFITKRDISFQDMQSIARAFKEYIEMNEIPRDKIVNNIILSQACRHCIVHNGSAVNNKVINQLKSANPRDLKTHLNIGEKILFNEEEIQVIIASMTRYIEALIFQLAR